MKSLSICRRSLLALSLVAAVAPAGCLADASESQDLESAPEEEIGEAADALTVADLAYKTVYLYNKWGCDTGDYRCGYNFGWEGTTSRLWAANDTIQQTPWLLIPVPGTTDQFYLQNKWHCQFGDGRCNMNLSWSGTTAELVDQSDFSDWVPWQFVKVPGTVSQFYLKNKWGCDVGDSRCDDYLGFSGLTGKLFPEDDDYNRTPWRVAVIQADTTDAELAYKFAPQLRFDGAAYDYPMSAQPFYDQAVAVPQTSRVENTSYSTVTSSSVPTYYQVTRCGDQVRIMYWWFYGYQDACDVFGNGTHNGDWERVMVTVSDDQSQVAAVTYWAHGGHYTRLTERDGVQLTLDTDPVIYPGKTSHASYYGQGGTGTCLYWEDWHNTDGSHMDTWHNLVSLDDSAEPWMIADREGGFHWGENGVSKHPTQDGTSCSMSACEYSTKQTAQMHSQCKDGDWDTGVECRSKCRSGYTDGGLICTNWSTFDSYTKHSYDYDYTLPTSDKGLLTSDPR